MIFCQVPWPVMNLTYKVEITHPRPRHCMVYLVYIVSWDCFEMRQCLETHYHFICIVIVWFGCIGSLLTIICCIIVMVWVVIIAGFGGHFVSMISLKIACTDAILCQLMCVRSICYTVHVRILLYNSIAIQNL